jgi:hypothetical protein
LHAGKFTPIDCLANCPRERLLANQNGSKQGRKGPGLWLLMVRVSWDEQTGVK